MILHTTCVEYLGDYRLFLSFDNGESGEVELSARLHGEVFAPLRDKTLFASACQHPMAHTVAWSNGADLAPEYLLDLMRSQRLRAA
ncbi:MAG: DUF2442 domain-containing protein [Sulfuricella sp.]|nr:DUF2442 domain-containing protein [Sulfuricella sp.]